MTHKPIPNDTDEILTVEAFAQRMKVGRSTAYGWIQAGKLVEGVHYFRTPGGRIRVSAWMAMR